MNFETARANMIEQQIRPWNVLEMQTLNALAEVRREDFVPKSYKNLAFADVQIPIGDNQVMLEPKVGARMVENLGLDSSSHLLLVGSGTGYLTALSATICQQVTALEIDSKLAAESSRNLSMSGFNNVEIVEVDFFQYLADRPSGFAGDYDCVLLTGSVNEVSKEMLTLLNPGGRMVAISGNNPAMQVISITSDGTAKSLFETSVPRLKNVAKISTFEF